MDAGDGAARGAALGGAVFAADVVDGVLAERLAGVAALLRAVVHQAVFADVEVAGAGAAAPVVLLAVRDVVLEIIQARVAALLHRLHGGVDFALLVAERLQLAVAVVDDPDGRGEAELERALADRQRVLRSFGCRRRRPS